MTTAIKRSRTPRALIVSIALHLFLLILLALFWHETYETELVSKPAVDVELYAPPKPRSVPLLLKVDNTPVSTRQRSVRQVAVLSASEEPSPTRTRVPNQPSASLPVTHPDRSELDIPGQGDVEWSPQAELPSAPSDLSEGRPGMQQGSGLGSGAVARPLGLQRNAALLDLEASGAGYESDDIITLPATEGADLPIIPMEQVLRTFAESIVTQSGGQPIDVVFVIDYSGSMQDNIDAVREHLMEMTEVYERSDLDYALGLVQFRAQRKRNEIRLFSPTDDWRSIRRELVSIRAKGDEHAFDAIQEATSKLVFRPASKRFFILATDEPFTSSTGWSIQDAISASREFNVITYVMGLDLAEHRQFADETEGRWHQIPQQPRGVQSSRRPSSRSARSRRSAARYLRNATWQGVKRVREHTLNPIANNKLDVLFVVDTSRSMEDKLPPLQEEIRAMFRAWDHALFDYCVGIATFRAGTGSADYLNMYQPPQEMAMVSKILALRSEGSERLLDAFAESLRRVEWRPDAERHVILVTDEPTTGRHPVEGVLRMTLQEHVTVSVIGTVDPFQQRLAEATGGVWVPIPEGYTIAKDAW